MRMPMRMATVVHYQSTTRRVTSGEVPMPVLRCKVAIVGDAKVGKSALTQMFHSDGAHYPKNYLMTVGVEFSVKTVNIPETNYTVELYLFDCSGQDIYADLIPRYVKGATMIALVYDVTNKESFENLTKWTNILKTNIIFANSTGDTVTEGKLLPGGVLIANKTDSEERTFVKPHLGNEFAQAHGLEFFETSALTDTSSQLRGKDVDAPFNYLASQYYESYVEKMNKQFKK